MVWSRVAAAAALSLIATLAVASCASDADRVEPQGRVSSSPSPGGVASSKTSSPSPDEGSPSKSDFTATVRRIGPGLRARMTYSHRAGCPVDLKDLRYLRMSFVRFDGRTGLGEMVVHEDQARAVVSVFKRLYDEKWPIRRMRLVDAYRGDDDRSMAADNTSAYNCRRVGGQDQWSEHAYGRAIDINPVENPYVQGPDVVPPRGARFANIDRSVGADAPKGVIVAGDVVVSEFTRIGWGWGAEWTSSTDYQHFSLTGG
jgi:poly-gamma-glutamate synthesis protein (capsule biosynthesis protein)